VDNVRASVHETVDELRDRVNKATDAREQIRTHPIAALAVATVAGLLIGRQLTSLVGLGGLAALGVGAARRATPASNGYVIADRIINSVGAALASAVLVPVISGLRQLVESSRGPASAEYRAGRGHP
jgi:uncharacterized membrane protein YedE/YeeE